MEIRVNECLVDVHAVMYYILLLYNLFTLVNVEISKDINKRDVGNYLNFYDKSQSPKLVLSASNYIQFNLYAKAAEDAVLQYNDKHQVEYQLREIVSYKNISKNVLSFTLKVQANHGGALIKGHFHVRLSPSHKTDRVTLLSAVLSLSTTNSTCDKISQDANCTQCDKHGRCLKGHVPVDPWLAFVLKTQREIQIDQRFTEVQFFAAHNAFNDRADGYGVEDNCPWPPPYYPECITLANQEFSFTDMLNMGYHALEIDPWWCFDEMHMSHAEKRAIGCVSEDRRFEDGMIEIGEWVHKVENQGKVIRLYFEDGSDHTMGHDDLINGPIHQYLGDKVFTPSDKRYYGGRWPTIRQLRQMNKTVIIATSYNYTHGGVYIHDGYWQEYIEKEFTPYPTCGGKNSSNTLRFYCDSTNYGPFWDGPKETGVILNFTEYVKCRIQYPAADQVSTSLLKTGVFTWAEGQPATSLNKSSCAVLNVSVSRWKVANDCQTQLYSACVNNTNSEHWIISKTSSVYGSKSACRTGFKFGLPVNGFQQQKIIEASHGRSVWINLTPYIPLLLTGGT